jgi:alpha-tubulin suppressor-like RCC1 family protein
MNTSMKSAWRPIVASRFNRALFCCCLLLATSVQHLCAADKYVTGWGANDVHQLEPPLWLKDAVAIFAGPLHAIALRSNGDVVTWGDDSFGQTDVPPSASNVVGVACGFRHSLALRADGSIVGWGDNLFGQASPPAGSNFVAIAAGGYHSLALRTDGSVAEWGASTYAPNLTGVKAIAAGAYHSLALKSNGTVVAWGDSGSGQTAVPARLTNVIAIASGHYHNLALRSNGTVVALGFNGRGQTNVPTGLTNVIAIAAGLSHSLALRQDGTVVAWGADVNEDSVPEGLTNAQRIAAGGNFSLAIVPGPALLRQPAETLIIPGQPITLTTLAVGNGLLTLQWQKDGEDVAGETNATLTLPHPQYDAFGSYRLRVYDGDAVVFSQIARLIAPPAILSQPQSFQLYYGSNATFQVTATGTPPLRYQWHLANSAINGKTNDTFTISNAVYQNGGSYFVVVSNCAGSVTSSVAQLTLYSKPTLSLQPALTQVGFDGSLYLSAGIAAVWPDSLQWQFNGADIPGARSSALQVTNMRSSMAGSYRFVATTPAGALYSSEVLVTVGRANPVNFVGRQIVLDAGTGYGLAHGFRWFRAGVELTAQTNSTLSIDALVQGDLGDYTAAVLFDGAEQLFDIARVTVLPAPPAGRIVSWGYANYLPGPPISQMDDIIGVAMGDSHMLALRADGKLFMWNYSGQSSPNGLRALEPVVGISSSGSGAAVLGATGKAMSDTWSYCSPCSALETNRLVQVAFGGEYAVGLRNDGTAIGWGISGGGNPVPAGLQGLVAVAAGSSHAMALRNDGRVVAWGSNAQGQTNVPAGLSGVKAIACGWSHSLALRSNGTVVAWGNNYNGQRDVPVGLNGVIAIGAGTSQSYAVLADGSVRAWGENSDGQCNVPSGLTGVANVTGGNWISAALVGSTAHPAIRHHPVGAVREVGEPFNFDVRAWSTAPLSYQWRCNGTNIPGAIAPSLTLTKIQLADGGDYAVAVTTTAGTVVSDAATLFVNRQPFLSLPLTRGRVVVWGGHDYYGHTPTAPQDLGEVATISAGPNAYKSYAIDLNGIATIWDNYSSFQLPASNLISVVRWGEGYLGLRANGVVTAWGANLKETNSPTGLRDVVQLVGNGSGSYIAVREDGSIAHSYLSTFFPTSLSNVIQAALGLYHGVVLRGDGTVVLSEIDYLSDQTPVPVGLSNVVQLAAGAEHTLALKEDGTVVAWGRNQEGQCDVSAGLSNVIAVAAGQYFSMALRSNGTVAVWGDGDQGQTLLPAGLTNVAAIAAGYSHCLAVQRGPVIVTTPHDMDVAPGQAGAFEIRARGAVPLSYQWFFGGEPLPNATNALLQVTGSPQTEGLYTVIVSNRDGSISAEAMLWLGLPAEILAQPAGGLIAAGSSKTFMVLASGLAPLHYQWQLRGTNITGATNSLFTLSSAANGHAGPYTVVITNIFGATTSQVAQLTVVSAPSIVTQPASQTRAEGETAQFFVATSGGQPQSYQWRFNGSALPGETNTSIIITNLGTNHAGAYSCRVNNIVSAVTSSSATLTVVGASPQFVSAPTNQTAGFGADVRWEVVVTGASPLSYVWRFNGMAISGATAPSLLISKVDTNDVGDYQVVVSNAFNSITSAPAHLSLRIPPNVVVWGSNTLVQAVPSDLTNAVAISASSHVLALRSDGTVTAWGLNDYGQASVPAGLSNAVAVAAGSANSLALKADGRVVSWGYDFGGWGLTNVPADLTNAIAIAAGSLHSLALRANGTVAGWGYNAYGQASPPAGLSNVVGLTANFDVTVALRADGTVTHWGNGYYGGDSLTNMIRVMGRERMLALRDDNRVLGWSWITGPAVEGPSGVASADSYTVPYQQGSTTYIETHEIGLLTNGTVAVWGTNRGGIFNPPGLSNVLAVSAGYFFNAAIVGGPTILRQPSSQTALEGTGVTLAVEATGHAPLKYQWRRNGANLAGSTNSTLTLFSVASTDTGQYSVAISDSTGLVTSRTVTLLVLTETPYLLRSPVSRSVAEGAEVSFDVEAVGASPLVYQWLHNGAVVNGATQSVLHLPVTAPYDAGFYSVRVSNPYGAASSSNAILTLGLADIIVDNTDAEVVGP